MGDQTNPTIAQAIAQALSDLQEPIPTKELIEKVLTIRPSSAKNPASSIRTHLRWQENGQSIAYLDRKTLVPLRTAMRGVRFRIPLSRRETKRGILLIEPALGGFVDLREFDDALQPQSANARHFFSSTIRTLLTEDPYAT